MNATHENTVSWKTLIVGALLVSFLTLPCCGGGGGGSGNRTPTGDVKPPKLLFTLPADGESFVSPYTAIELVFSEKIAPASIGQDRLLVKDTSGAISGQVRLNSDKKTLIFEPDAPLSHNVTITVSAAGSIKDLSGNPIGSEITFEFVTAPLPDPATISGNTSAHFHNQSSAFNDDGDGLLVWQVENGGASRVYAARYDHATAQWSEEEELTSPGLGAEDPSVATNGDDIMVVWRSGGLRQIYARRLAMGVWGDPVELSASGWDPCIASNGNSYVAVWSESYDLCARTHSAGSGWDDTVVVSQGQSTAYDPDIATVCGSYCATWKRSNTIFAALYSSTTSIWGNEVGLGQSNCFPPQISASAIHPSVGYVVAWYDGNQQAMASAFFDLNAHTWMMLTPLQFWSGSRSGPVLAEGEGFAYMSWCEYRYSESSLYLAVFVPVALQWSVQTVYVGTDYVDNPCLAVAGADCAVAWRQTNGSGHDILACVNNGAHIKLDFGIGGGKSPRMAPCGDTFFATWNHKHPDGMDRLFGARYVDYNGGWDYENFDGLSEGDHVGDCRSPVAAVDSAGLKLALWEQYDSGDWQIHGNFCDDGIWGTPFLMADCGEKPQVASNGDSFLAAWTIPYKNPGDFESIGTRCYSGGSWSDVEIVSTDSCDVYGLRPIGLASDGEGYLLSWFQYVVQNNESRRGVVSRHLDIDQSHWGDLEVHEWSLSRPRGISTVSNGAGFAVVWNQHEGSGYSGTLSLRARVFDGAAWDDMTTIESSDDDIQFFDLASDGQGYAVVAEGLSVRHNGSEWLPEEEMTQNSVRESFLASNGSGYAAVWPNRDYPMHTDIRASLFDGSSWGPEMTIDLEQDRLEFPSIASNGTGYAVIWPQDAGGQRYLWACTFGRSAWRGAFRLSNGDGLVSEVCTAHDGSGYSAIWTEGLPDNSDTCRVKGAVSF